MEDYINRIAVGVQAEFMTEGEHQGLWHTLDVSGNHNYLTEEQFEQDWTPVKAAPTSTDAPPAPKGKK